MTKIKKIHTMSDNANNDQEEETTMCYRPFKKRITDHSSSFNSVPGRACQRKTSNIGVGSSVSLNLAMVKMSGIDVYDEYKACQSYTSMLL
ncbi:hypothetical protein TrispH2_008672 [Trichoplax sp. H2]|nr:hypothetical protein TrispH2_008672 [Trichoplax sp. H2]|eukprot:RDD39280.1 hypothetical protein TrispH2_008672 [Trichoplax sp. H2]